MPAAVAMDEFKTGFSVPTQTLIAKPAFRALDQLFPCPAPMKTPRLFMKQTIISTFFSNKPEGMYGVFKKSLGLSAKWKVLAVTCLSARDE